jgi:hypothetical protein
VINSEKVLEKVKRYKALIKSIDEKVPNLNAMWLR